jgi:hypothetical protein
MARAIGRPEQAGQDGDGRAAAGPTIGRRCALGRPDERREPFGLRLAEERRVPVADRDLGELEHRLLPFPVLVDRFGGSIEASGAGGVLPSRGVVNSGRPGSLFVARGREADLQTTSGSIAGESSQP